MNIQEMMRTHPRAGRARRNVSVTPRITSTARSAQPSAGGARIVSARDAGCRRSERARADQLTRRGPPGNQLERRALGNGVQVPFGLAVHASRALIGAAADFRRKTVAIAARSRDSIAQRGAALLTGIRIQEIDCCCSGGCTHDGQPDCCSDFRSRSPATTQEK
jgi:hypothetical protein